MAEVRPAERVARDVRRRRQLVGRRAVSGRRARVLARRVAFRTAAPESVPADRRHHVAERRLHVGGRLRPRRARRGRHDGAASGLRRPAAERKSLVLPLLLREVDRILRKDDAASIGQTRTAEIGSRPQVAAHGRAFETAERAGRATSKPGGSRVTAFETTSPPCQRCKNDQKRNFDGTRRWTATLQLRGLDVERHAVPLRLVPSFNFSIAADVLVTCPETSRDDFLACRALW